MSSSPKVILEGLPEDKIRRAVWWYCDLEKNESAQSEPKVKVCCRKIHDDNSLGDDFFYYPAGITNLGQVPLGTIFQGRNKIGQLDKIDKYDIVEEEFQLDFDDGAWGFATSWGKISENAWIIPPFSYSLPNRNHHLPTKIATFHFTSAPFGLIIPCLEIFSRLYGRSQYVKRVLTTNPFDMAIEKLIVPDVAEAPDNAWQITMDKHCYDEDGIFLAHLRHDHVVKTRVRSIWGQSEGSQNTKGNVPVFPEIGPWFAGTAQLKVRGLWLDNKQERFLALQILGCSEPGGVEIYLDRQNTNMVTGPLKKVRDKTTWPKVDKQLPQKRKEVLLRYSEEPGAGLNAREILDEPFEVLGRKRKVTKIVRDHKGDREQHIIVQEDSGDQCSGGEAHGKKEDVDQATIHAPEKVEFQGTLRDAWNALVNLATDSNLGIKSVASVSNDCSISNSAEPTTFTFSDFDIEKGLNPRKRKWLFLDPTRSIEKRKSRCMLLARVETELGIGYLLEIQRRTKISTEGMLEEKEKFKGFAFRLENDCDLTVWLPSFLISLARAKGILDNAMGFRPKVAYAYKHVHDKQGSLKSAVLNALSKIELFGQNINGTEVCLKSEDSKIVDSQK